MVDQANKQVRVDNWGTFFLQRLQVFFAKTDYCDLTLQFEGNVQLKVHRLVMNACTEYFRFLEETCSSTHEDNTIIMPHDLQSNVIVPIVNFMYTGMLEFHISLFEKLYKAAELMNITILTKLLDAQKMIPQPKLPRSRAESSTNKKQPPSPSPTTSQKPPLKSPFSLDLPSSVSSRRVPAWKRKNTAPAAQSSGSTSHSTSQLQFDQKWSNIPSDPLADTTPKPTRFEWPEDELPPINLMDTSFVDISYTSKPLLTKEEEEKIKPNFDDLRHNVELPKKLGVKPNANANGNSVSFKDIAEFSKEQRIRNTMFEDLEDVNDVGQKRKAEPPSSPVKVPPKKIKVSNKENKETTISVESVTAGDIDHTKIVTEILKKYPDLVKKNKNIKLKIMPGNKDAGEKKVVNAVVEPVRRPLPPAETVIKSIKVQKPQIQNKKPSAVNEEDDEGPWSCKKCISSAGEVQEFVLYYLYRKHMTDVHDEVFDSRTCKYCGRRCNTHNLMLYHLYTKHALKPPSSYNFPKCDRCPYIGLSPARLQKHKGLHNPNEMQCQDCQLAFVSSQCLSRHIRVTGHYNKPGRVSYDCQYCMKKLQSGVTLFSHVIKCHPSEANADGMVTFNDLESLEDMEEDDEAEEYILPEILTDNITQKDKVKIISNVKVPPNRQDADSTQQSQVVPMEASSEAEALNNVATGIATSLGLVDIVVLDDNQQYILQQDSQNEQTEFILPELAHGQPFSGQVITTQDNAVIQQGMIQSSTGDIASTDELVMVLTDHDYPDDHGGENPENSNIVVLYSHPVDGQEGQFITSQGNLMVNSHTGMLELRSGSTIATTAGSEMIVTNSVDTPIESIEMIQREINSHTSNLKQEPFFEEEKKPEIQQSSSEQPPTKLQNMPDIQDTSEENTEQLTSENQTEELNTSAELPALEPEEHIEEPAQEPAEESSDQIAEEVHEDKDTSEDNIDGSLDVSTEEPMEIDVEHKTAETEDQDDSIFEEEVEQEPVNTEVSKQQPDDTEIPEEDVFREETSIQNENEGVDVPPGITNESDEYVELNDPSVITSDHDKELERKSESNSEERPQQDSQAQNVDEPMEVEDQVQERMEEVQQDQENKTENVEENTEQSADSLAIDETDQPVLEMKETEIAQEEGGEEEKEDKQETEVEAPIENPKHQSTENNTPQIAVPQTVPKKSTTDINKTILDDWADDTDSQQSEKNTNEPEVDAAEDFHPEAESTVVDNVNKLMDDWDEEDEEEKKD